MFSPLEILYIVLAFCALWLTAAFFWLIWQVASMFKRVNDTVTQVQETMGKMEKALDGIRQKFDHTSTALGAIMHTATKAVEYFMEKRVLNQGRRKSPKKKEESKS
jgi:DNA anti-recombination protein RmuC